MRAAVRDSPLMRCRERDVLKVAVLSWACALEMRGRKDDPGLRSEVEVGYDEFTLFEELYFDGAPNQEAWLVEDQAWWSESVSIGHSARLSES